MSDSLLDTYNPLYDIHLQQYFALPHMQKHLRRIGLIDSSSEAGDEAYARHHAMLDMILKNREVQLMRMAELRKKLDAAEKVETCRRIRSGQSPESYNRVRSSRSLSRGRQHSSEKQRRYSNSLDDKEIVQKIENEHVQPVDYDPKDPYSRLSANIKRFQYLHRLDDPTLCTYKENLKKQLLRLERFRDVSFGIHSVARHPPTPHQSWFFRRRSSNSTRGRKSHQSPRSTANHSNDSRTSCPPSGRKRKDSRSRLPPIGNGKTSKSFNPQSHPWLSAPSPSQKPPTVRGRPVTKKPTTTPKTKVTTTHVVPPQNNGAPSHGISRSTAIEEQSAIATIEKANKSHDDNESAVDKTLSTDKQCEAEAQRHPIGVTDSRTAVEACNEHFIETVERSVVQEENSSLSSLRNGDGERKIFENITEHFSRSDEQHLMNVDSSKADHHKRDDEESSENEMIEERKASEHLTLNEKSVPKYSELHQGDFAEKERMHAKDSTHSAEDVSSHTVRSLSVEEANKFNEEVVTCSTDLNLTESPVTASRTDEENEKNPKKMPSSFSTCENVAECEERHDFTGGKTLHDGDLKVDDHLCYQKGHSLQEQKDGGAFEYSHDDNNLQEQKKVDANDYNIVGKEEKSSGILRDEIQDTTHDHLSYHKDHSLQEQKDGGTVEYPHDDNDLQEQKKVDALDYNFVGKEEKSSGILREEFQDPAHDHLSYHKDHSLQEQKDGGTVEDPHDDNNLQEQKKVDAIDYNFVGKEEKSSGILREEFQCTTPQLKENRQKLEAEILTVSNDNLPIYENAESSARHGASPSMSLSKLKPENHIKDDCCADKLSFDSNRCNDEGSHPSDHSHEVNGGLSENVGIMTESQPKNGIPLEDENVSHEESIMRTMTAIQSDTQSLKSTDHEQLCGQLTSEEGESTFGDFENEEDELKKRVRSPDFVNPLECDDTSTDSVVIHDTEHMPSVEHEMSDIPVNVVHEPNSSISYLQRSGEEQATHSTYSNNISDTVHISPSFEKSTQSNTSDLKFSVINEEDVLQYRDVCDSHGNERDNIEVSNRIKGSESSDKSVQHFVTSTVHPCGIETDNHSANANLSNNADVYHCSETINDDAIHHNITSSFAGSDEENNNEDGKSIKSLSGDEASSLPYNSDPFVIEGGLANGRHHKQEHKDQNILSS